MRRALALLLTVSLLILPLPPLRADDSDIFGANIQPNVLILLDTSGSMNDEIHAEPYSASTTYAGSYTSGKVYKRSWSWRSGYTYSVYKNSIGEVPNASAQTALTNNGYWSGRIGGSWLNLFTGNYLNYLASPAATLTRKIDIAKRVLNTLVDTTEGVRFGLMRFADNASRGSGGGAIVQPVGTSKPNLITSINSLSVGGYTPLGEQARDAGRYFEGLGDYYGNYRTSPIQYDCQPNFIIIISDGLQNGSADVQGVAATLYAQDHAGWLPGKQNIIVHTVGFAVAADERDAANAVLERTARNGGGTFYTTENETQLSAALQDAIRQIVAATFAFATPVIPTTSATGSTKTFLAAFQSNPSRPFWRGYIKAYQRGADGQVPTDADGVPLDSALVWEAGALLSAKPAAERTIYTVIGGSRQEFTKANSNLTAALLGVSTATDRDKVIDFTRGVDTYDEDGDLNTTEERAWKLGDIFHSTPVLISPPFLPALDSSYQAFKNAYASRTTVLIAGANDGMLHAFRESDGQELWAFALPDLLGRLKDLAAWSGSHAFFADGSPIAADVKIGGSWKTVLIVGERRGGRNYYALDITDTTSPLYLWSFTDSKMGETWSEPVIGKVRISDGTEKAVAFVGGGYDTANNNATGKAFFAIDIATGQKLWEYYNAPGSTDDRQYMNFSLAANPLALDLNSDGYVDRIYIGDVGGQVWKFDLSAPATLSGGMVTNWTGKRVFAANPSQANPPPTGEYYPAQAIYAPINAALDEQGNLWIYFGTGDRNHPNNTSANRFYGIKDNTSMGNGSVLTESNLVDVTSTDATATQGWYVRLASTEKVLAAADIFNRTVYFSTFTPTTTTSCGSGGGTAKLYAVQMVTGYAAVDWAHDAAVLTTTSASQNRAKTIGTGIPSKPIVIITESGATLTTSVVAATTSQQLPSNPAPPPSSMRRVLYWREVF